jgi:hypothetical protein
MSAEKAVRRGIQQALEVPSYEPTPPTTFHDSLMKTWDKDPDYLKLSMIKGEAAIDVVVAQMIYDCKEDWIDRDKRQIVRFPLTVLFAVLLTMNLVHAVSAEYPA